jgi:GH24 family phage-related lysozyme (muramidase)
MNLRKWSAIAAISAAGIAFTLQWEGAPAPAATEAIAIIPVPGDPPTLDVGGLTYYPSTGQRVQLGDRLPIAQAIKEFSQATGDNAQCVRRSCPDCATPQTLFDLAGDFVHQFGCPAWEKSSALTHIRAGRLAAHCDVYLRYRYVRKFDCATPGNRRCPGVWTRAQERARLCKAALEEDAP